MIFAKIHDGRQEITRFWLLLCESMVSKKNPYPGHNCHMYMIFIGHQHHQLYIPVVRNPKTKLRSPSSYRIFKAKSPTAQRTLQHICKAHKNPT